jgi:hypothetical protein
MGHIYKRGNIYWIKYFNRGAVGYESSHSSKYDDAVNLLKQREGLIAQGVAVTPKMGNLMFEEARDDFLNERRINSSGPITKLEARIANHLEPFFGRRRMADISTMHIRAYTAERKKAGAANGTINRELTILKRMFSLAIQADRLVRKPHIPLLVENNTRTGFFEPDAIASVIAHLPEAIRPIVRFAYITGWRVNSEVLPME